MLLSMIKTSKFLFFMFCGDDILSSPFSKWIQINKKVKWGAEVSQQQNNQSLSQVKLFFDYIHN